MISGSYWWNVLICLKEAAEASACGGNSSAGVGMVWVGLRGLVGLVDDAGSKGGVCVGRYVSRALIISCSLMVGWMRSCWTLSHACWRISWKDDRMVVLVD